MAGLSPTDLDFFFEPAHRALAEELEQSADAIASAKTSAEAARVLGETGFYRHLLPARAEAVDVRALCTVRELLGYISPLADAIFAVQGLGSYPILLAGAVEQQIHLDAYRKGERIGAFALTEPEAGSDVAAMATVAEKDGGNYRLNGIKTLISNAGIATDYIVFANAEPSAGRRGITAFQVPADAAGLEVRPLEVNIDHPIGQLVLSDCRVPATAILGEKGGGFRLAMQTLDTFRVTVGAAAVGMARRAVDAALAHVKGRVQFGKRLADQPVVQSLLAEMVTELDASRLMVLRAAHAKDTGGGAVTVEAAMAKLYATEAAQKIIDQAVQLHGGLGVTRGEVVELLYRAIRPLRIYEGTSEIQRLIIGKALTAEPKEKRA